MDLKKIGSQNWSDTGKLPDSANAVRSFLQDVHDTKAQSDLRFTTKPSRSGPLTGTMGSSPALMTASAPQLLPQLRTTAPSGDGGGGHSPTRKAKKMPQNPMRKPPPGTSYAIQERPANRAEIEALDRELEERVKVVLYRETTDLHAVETGDLYQPHKDAMLLIRDSMLDDFGVSLDVLSREQWLDKLIKCECLRTVCDHVAAMLNDMLSVSSSELGSVLRKLRFTYKQSFDQMHMSARQLHYFYVDTKRELEGTRKELATVRIELSKKDAEMKRDIEHEVALVRMDFEGQRALDQDTIAQTEHQMTQMSETLKSLNGIFKAMQADGSAARTADLVNKAQKLEKENADLLAKCAALEDTKIQLSTAEAQIAFMEAERLEAKSKIEDMERELQRRESVVAMLMEKDALRTAELEKMQRVEEAKRHKEAIDVSAFEETPTSVLCIRCKRSLDDLSNIRAAVYGYGGAISKKKQCEAFRSLLPNLKGRRPARNVSWLRTCMRSILLCKMREDVTLLQIKGDISRFPHFVYAWFDKTMGGGQKLSSQEVASLQAHADEDRWGLYYGIKAMAKDDPEAQVFWGLLDEAHGEDGQQFLFHCLSIALSLGGAHLWYQMGWPLFQVNGVQMMTEVLELKGWHEVHLKSVVWFDVETCKEVVRMVLVRALKAQIGEAIEAIEALKVVPEVEDPLVPEKEDDDDSVTRKGRGKTRRDKTAKKTIVTDPSVLHPSSDATHINLFMWLRVMLQQLQSEQIHRGAACKLMFESAAAGALTHTVTADDEGDGGNGGQSSTIGEGGDHVRSQQQAGRPLSVEYPQFQAICRTLFPSVGAIEVASLFSQCFEDGRHKQGVTSEVFMRVADLRGLFSRSLRLSTLPVLEQHSPMPLHQVATDIKRQAAAAAAAADEASVASADVSVVGGEVDDNASVGTLGSHEVIEDDGEERKLKAAPLTAVKRETLRVKLGSLVHRKLSAILPDLFVLAANVPEKWRALLLDAASMAQTSVGDSLDRNKMKAVRGGAAPGGTLRGGGSAGDVLGSGNAMNLYIDGLQPFVQYRRLLSLALLVRSMTDNPLLPTEIFADKHRQFSGEIDISLRQAETLLSNLEAGILSAPGPAADASGLGPHTSRRVQLALRQANRVLPWSVKFELSRRKLVARRIQVAVRAFLNHASVVVPRPVRRMMRAGYLRGARALRTRAVMHEPWWVTAQIAEVYAFKLSYDAKACKLGLPPIALGEAVAAFNFTRYGVVEVAERETHDLFFAMKAYMMALPRVRLFASFLGVVGAGDYEDLPSGSTDEDKREGALMETVLRSPHALSCYLDLLVEVHREIVATRTWKALFKQRQAALGIGSSATSANASVAAPESARSHGGSLTDADDDRSQRADEEEEDDEDDGDDGMGGLQVRGRGAGSTAGSVGSRSVGFPALSASVPAPPEDPMHLHTLSLPQVMASVDVLFPSSESCFQRMDRRDVWLLEKDMLKRAGKRWAQSLRAQQGANPTEDNAMGAFFEDLPELLRASVGGEVDVDDFFYLTMVQWAKLTAISFGKSAHKVAWVEKNNPAFRAAAAATAVAAAAAGVSAVVLAPTRDVNVPAPLVGSRAVPAFNALFLRQFVESMYFLQLPGDVTNTPGPRFVAGGPPAPTPPLPVYLSDPANQAASYLRMVVCRARREWDPSTMSDVLAAYLMENSLWDLNTGNGKAAEASSEELSGGNATVGKGVPPGQNSAKQAPAQPLANAADKSAPSASSAGPQSKDAASRMYSLRAVHMSVAPEVSLMAAKQAFVAYQDAFTAKILQINRRRAADKDASSSPVHGDVERLLAVVGRQIAEFADRAAWIDSLVLAPKGGSAVALSANEVQREQDRRVSEARRCWALLHAMLCAMHDVVTLSGEEMPKDPWEAGRKVYVERAAVYSIPLQKRVFA